MEKPIIEFLDISKIFLGKIYANQNCSLCVKSGEVHAVIGENGAGKSTLMNILYGLYQPDEGEIKINGEPVKIENPRHAKSIGIQMVHQHFMLVPSFTVLQNIILGFEPRTGIFINQKEAVQKVKEICETYQLSVPLNKRVMELPVGLQQKVEIVKAIYRQAEILILDEPTAVLTPQEVEELFLVCEEMKKNNKTIIFISHKLKEVMRISNRITVMRKGRTIKTIEKVNTSEKELADLIIGEEKNASIAEHILKEDLRAKNCPDKKVESPVILELKDLVVKDYRGQERIRNVSMSIHSGEIVGIAGVEGNGQSELIESVAGLCPFEKGDIKFKGVSLQKISVHQRRAMGLRHIPQDRIKSGLCIQTSICDNLIADQIDRKKFLNSFRFIDWSEAKLHSDKLISDFGITAPSPETLVKTLSGGNMQKVVVTRELTSEHDCLLIAHPTRGVDIGAADFIYQKIFEAKKRGVAILLISADLDELYLLSDRLAILYEGEIAGEFEPGCISAREIGLYMTGAKKRAMHE